MDITPLISKDKNIIHAYGPEGFKINQTLYKNAVVLTPSQLIEIKINLLEEIDWKILKGTIDLDLEILLIGGGNNHIQLPESLKAKIKNFYPSASINEMTTSAACRTYNILVSEDRKVGAVLMRIKF